MLAKQNYFLGISLPKKESELFSNLRKDLENREELSSPPHITLIPPFASTEDIFNYDYLFHFSQKQKPFLIKFSVLEVFRHQKYATLVLTSPNPEKLLSFQKELSLYVGINNEKRPYKPHLTLANKVSYEVLNKKIKIVEQLHLSLDLKVSSLVLFYKESSRSVWVPKITAPFMV